MQVKISQAISMVTKYILAKLVPMLTGSPGCGKSQIIHQIAADYDLKVIDLRLSQCDVTDLNGFPQILGNKAGYVPMDTFPVEGDAIPEGYSGWLLFLDEMNGAVPSVQAAAYKLVLDRMVGQHRLHKNVAIVCAGNLETDNGIVNPMPTPLQSRMVHLELVVDQPEWNDWANGRGLDHRITSHMNFKPGNLYTFRPDHTDNTYACPRTWEFADRILKLEDITSKDMLPMLAGTLSEGVAREFLGYCKIFQDLPTTQDIVRSPSTVRVPDEPSILFALTGSLAHHASTDNFAPLVEYILRLPAKFQTVCMREASRRNVLLKKHPAMQTWLTRMHALV